MKTIHTRLMAGMFLLVALIPAQIQAQKAAEKEFTQPVFTTIRQVETTPVLNQGSTGTCWCFATTSMIESELIRMGKEPVGLSEMFTVRKMYADKAERYVRFHGTNNFDEGGAQHDVMTSIRKYGIVPREIYPGLNYGTDKHAHGEIVSVLKGMVDNVIKNRNGKLTPVWLKGFNSVLDAYFGECQADFEFMGKRYTPKSFASEIGINPDDYVEFSSFTHHPFYSMFVLEVPDNWAHQSMYNVPVNDLMRIIDQALEKGISITWAADISGLNFSEGVGLILAENEDPKNLMAKEKDVQQEDRQYLFDSYHLTDDHAMHLVGVAKDQNGKKYYMEKNSWGEGGKYKGFSYMSESFMKLRTMSIMVHKDAVPADIAKKIGL